MDQLSQADRAVIAKNPLNDCLTHLHEQLQAAEFCVDSNATPLRQKAISRLLTTLLSQEIALDLHSNIRKRTVANELVAILERIRSSDFSYDHYQPICRLVVNQAPDVDIWAAVLDLITSLSPLKASSSAGISYPGTPITRSTSSFQGSEQTKKKLEAVLFYEIQYCTYRGVEGFFTKFFEGKKWSKKVDKIYDTVKSRHVEGRWTDFPDPPTQEGVSQWLSRFQNEFLSDAPGIYYTSRCASDLTGIEAKRQLDFFIKARSYATSDATSDKHDWNEIHVIGEHKQSRSDFKTLLLQLSRYIRDIFISQPTRRFVHGFLLHGTTMELWVFDRSGPYSSGEFDINKQPEKFINAIAGYAFMNEEELGLDTFIKSNQNGTLISLRSSGTRKRKNIYLEPEPIVIQRAIVCRGTVCYRSKDQKVVKFSWTSDKRPSEAKHLKLAFKKGVKGVAKLLGQQRITTIEKLRHGLAFPPRPYHFREPLRELPFSQSQSYTTLSQSCGSFQGLVISRSSTKRKHLIDQEERDLKRFKRNSQTSKCRDNLDSSRAWKEQTTSLQAPRDEKFDNRLFTCLAISPAGRPITKFYTIVELLTALRDAIKAHRSLYFTGKILHRDISENNIIITAPEKAKGFTGMLIDLDLAKELDNGRSGARHQTGTMEFMAIQVLRKTAHTYRHDLESFFYVLLWICARRVWEMEFKCRLADRPTRNILQKWYIGTFDDIADAKEHHMGVNGFKAILEELPTALDSIKPLCRKIRSLLFPVTQDGELDLGTSNDPVKLYTAIEEAFDEAITNVAAEDD